MNKFLGLALFLVLILTAAGPVWAGTTERKSGQDYIATGIFSAPGRSSEQSIKLES